ncbi:MAG: heme-binding protein [Acidobacteriota bacterium]
MAGPYLRSAQTAPREPAGYIFGANDGGRKIAMTAPVGSERTEDGWVVTFTMPSSFTMKTLPTPNDTRVHLRAIPSRRVVVVRFSGTWGADKFETAAKKLAFDAKEAGLVPADMPPAFARYDPPWPPWFIRRNEVLVPLIETR